jgi:hypothetical protein
MVHYASIRGVRGSRTRQVQGRDHLVDVLQHFRTSKCKDPRDKVYAALSVADLGKTLRLKPDYRKSLTEVYLDVVRGYLSSCKDAYYKLDFLGFAEVFDEEKMKEGVSLPTWLPDWRMSLKCPLNAF